MQFCACHAMIITALRHLQLPDSIKIEALQFRLFAQFRLNLFPSSMSVTKLFVWAILVSPSIFVFLVCRSYFDCCASGCSLAGGEIYVSVATVTMHELFNNIHLPWHNITVQYIVRLVNTCITWRYHSNDATPICKSLNVLWVFAIYVWPMTNKNDYITALLM